MSISNEEILQSVESLEDYLISTRRYLHENPELSGMEIETSKFLKKRSKKIKSSNYWG